MDEEQEMPLLVCELRFECCCLLNRGYLAISRALPRSEGKFPTSCAPENGCSEGLSERHPRGICVQPHGRTKATLEALSAGRNVANNISTVTATLRRPVARVKPRVGVKARSNALEATVAMTSRGVGNHPHG